ncbi:MAG: RluA family pseudouridine synthase [Christensenellaceae bacterium]|nr:RluA family pseudouridine synthase [Christensenellaceae bacterium]
MKVLFEDSSVVVCIKPVGVLSQESSDGGESMISLLREKCDSDIYPVHRLDRAVGGMMVFAKTAKAAADLSRQVQDRTLQKEYLAVVHGDIEQPQGVLEDILFKDSSKNKSFVVKSMRKGAKKASLEYKVIGKTAECSLVAILLHTGRTHQIRVQFASRRHPLFGDGKYGGRDAYRAPALWSAGLRFQHPLNKKEMYFREVPGRIAPWNIFPEECYNLD